jgi:N-acetylglucosaminyldiphosphoundecaprenol N-acetyl-beta-D-mannosaminyltransferase
MPADTARFVPTSNRQRLSRGRPPELLPLPGYGGATPEILGVPIKALSVDDVIEAIDQWVTNGDQKYICTMDVHALTVIRADPDLRRIYGAAEMVTPDGMPLVWYLRHHGFPQAQRVCGPDLMPAVMNAFQGLGYRHYLYGASERTLQALMKELKNRFPGIKIVGAYSPPYRGLAPREAAQIDRMINDTAPDIVWVGLGAPKQDRWMAEHRATLNAPVLIGVGAAFDMVGGTIPRAPEIMQRAGLEWIFRIALEPRRLLGRYVVSNWRFALALAAERLKSSPASPKF